MRRILKDGVPAKKLSKQLFRVILSLYLMIAVTITTFQLGMEFILEKDKLGEQVTSIVDTILPAVTEAMWNYDDEQMELLLKGIYKNVEIYGIKIDAKKGDTYIIGHYIDEHGQPREKDADMAKPHLHAFKGIYNALYWQTINVMSPQDQEEKLGEVTVYYSSNTVIDRTYKTFITTILSALVKTIGLWFIATTMINRLVGNPITKMQQNILAMDIDEVSDIKYSQPEEKALEKLNEIQYLTECFEALKAELCSRNTQIKEYTENLENRVNDKTRNLSLALDELVQANKAKSVFLSQMSHELKTPLNSIIGFTQRILNSQSDKLDEKSIQGLNFVLDNGKELLSKVNELLDLDGIQSGQVELVYKETNLHKITNDIIHTLFSMASDKEIAVKNSINSDCTAMLDSDKIKQALLNLLTNILKLARKGAEINISANDSRRNDVPGIEIVIREVAVTERGTADEQHISLPNAADIFDASKGLSLMLTKEIIERHQGMLRMFSETSAGHEIHIWIPKTAH